MPIELTVGENPVKLMANIDTGAHCCIFQRQYGEALGLNIESGERKQIGQVDGHFFVYGHSVNVSCLGLSIESIVYFAEKYSMNRNVLGRRGWLDLVRMAIVHYDANLYLSNYNDSDE